VIPGTATVGYKWMGLGLALHVAAYLGREVIAVQYGVGAVAGLMMAWGCCVYLEGKGYPKPLGIPAFALSIVWIGVCLLVPDREQPDLPPAQLPPRSPE
jgi:hypothetical protein